MSRLRTARRRARPPRASACTRALPRRRSSCCSGPRLPPGRSTDGDSNDRARRTARRCRPARSRTAEPTIGGSLAATRDRWLGNRDQEPSVPVAQGQRPKSESRLAWQSIKRRWIHLLASKVDDVHAGLFRKCGGQHRLVDCTEAHQQSPHRRASAVELLLGEGEGKVVLADQRAAKQELADAKRRRRRRGQLVRVGILCVRRFLFFEVFRHDQPQPTRIVCSR